MNSTVILRMRRVATGLSASALAVVIGVSALGAQPALAQVAGDTQPGVQLLASEPVADCADLTPTSGSPRGTQEGTGEGTLVVENCTAAGVPGDLITVHGTGFAQRDGGYLVFKLDDANDLFPNDQPYGELDQGGVKVSKIEYLPDANGNFTVQLRLPNTVAVGEVHWIRVLGGNDEKGTQASKWAKFQVGTPVDPDEPQLALAGSSSEVLLGSNVDVTGSGFNSRKDTEVGFKLRANDGTVTDVPTAASTVTIAEDGTFAATLTVPEGLAAGAYDLVAVSGDLEATRAVTLEQPTAPSFGTDLTSIARKEGADVQFSVQVNGAPRPTVSWQFSDDGGVTWNDIAGADTANARGTVSYSAGRMQTAFDGRLYRVSAVNEFGAAQSIAAVVLTAASDATSNAQVRPEGWNCESVDVPGTGNEGLCLVTAVASAGKLHLEGTGWTTSDGAFGSCIAVKFDGGDVIATNPPVSENGATSGTCGGGGTTNNIFAYVEADNSGAWIADVPIPTVATSTTLAASGRNWADGEKHSVTLLTGSSRSGDASRSVTLSFGIGTRVNPAIVTETTEVSSSESATVAPTTARSTGLVSTAAAAAEQQPLITPAAPVADAAELTDLNRGDLEVATDGTVLTVTFPSLAAGDWVYLHAWPGPQAVGWVQLDADRKVRFDIANLEPGDHQFSFVGEQGQLVGWVSATLDGRSDRQTFTSDAATSAGVAGAVTSASTGWNGTLVAIAFGVLLAGLTVSTTLNLVSAGASARKGK